MKGLRIFLIIIAALFLVYFLGPSPGKPQYSTDLPLVPDSAIALENFVRAEESSHKIKPDNEARIIWFDSSKKQPTEYSVVYLHGFSASQMEGSPTHTDFAKTYGCNLYLSRLADHGLDTTEPLMNLTADKYWESAKEAMQIGKKIGKKLILMGTSTGASIALQLAATYPDDVFALILFSPNIAINDPNAFILNNHWGLQIARLVKDGDYNFSSDTRDIYKQYWYWKYRLEGAVALQEMLETAMTKETFEKVKQPLLMLYYFKDDEHQDDVVQVGAMLRMFKEVSTPGDQKRALAIPNAGDHVIASPLKSKDVELVNQELNRFAVDVLHMNQVE